MWCSSTFTYLHRISSFQKIESRGSAGCWNVFNLQVSWSETAQEPIFCPAVGDFKQGMVVLHPQQPRQLKQNHGNTRPIQKPHLAMHYRAIQCPCRGHSFCGGREKILCECLFVCGLFVLYQWNPISYTLSQSQLRWLFKNRTFAWNPNLAGPDLKWDVTWSSTWTIWFSTSAVVVIVSGVCNKIA